MINKLKQWWASRHQPDAVEVALMNDAVNAEQAMIGLARAFVLDQQRRADETRRAARFKRWMVGVVVVVKSWRPGSSRSGEKARKKVVPERRGEGVGAPGAVRSFGPSGLRMTVCREGVRTIS